MAFTVRNGREITLTIEAAGRQLAAKEIKLFDDWIASTSFTPALPMPPLPTGLTFDQPFILESDSLSVRYKGTTTPGALVTGSLISGTDAPFKVGEAVAKPSGTFSMTVTLPREGVWTLHIESALDGYETTASETPLTANKARIPINLNEPLEGEIWDAQPRLAGKTLAGTEIVVSDGAAISKRTTADGLFSIKLNPEPAGSRVVTVTLRKKGYDERTVKYVFDRRWQSDDYETYLTALVKSAAYASVVSDPGKLTGRIVKLTGLITESVAEDGNTSARLNITPLEDTASEYYCVANEELPIERDSVVTLYGEITGDVYALAGDADQVDVSLPIVRILLVIDG
jgi:hypothetical protein